MLRFVTHTPTLILGLFVTLVMTAGFATDLAAEPTASKLSLKDQAEFNQFLKPLFEKSCVDCHGKKKTKGKIDLFKLTTAEKLLAKPDLIKEVIEVIEFQDMPPEDDADKYPPLPEAVRNKAVSQLKRILSQATIRTDPTKGGLHRLNRLQYNNTLRDLFQIDRDILSLPEKFISRKEDYITGGTMPDIVSLNNTLIPAGFKDVEAFPQDLRASHGFDNQGDQLSLSPLLLDQFMQLSVSIMESPDFGPENIGIWNDYFMAPEAAKDVRPTVRQRLKRFMTLAFRHAPEPAVIDRYTDYMMRQLKSGQSYLEAKKQITSAILSSPLFLYRYPFKGKNAQQYELASRLSFFLWGSCPDEALLALAAQGQLSQPQQLSHSVDRMLKDPKMERFLDAFPVQWMQLENILAASPTLPKLAKLFYKKHQKPGVKQHMAIEPLLIFDTVFVENRPLIDLIKPDFQYRSDILSRWYKNEMFLPPWGAEDDKALKQFITNKSAKQLKDLQLQQDKLKTLAAQSPAAMQLSEKIRKMKEALDKKQQGLTTHFRKNRGKSFTKKLAALTNDLSFKRSAADDPRYGGIMTSAAMLSMTSSPKRTLPIARGAWIIEVILNDPPPPPPNDVPPLNEESDKHLTIKEKFARHRENPDCAGCHARIDPLGFAMENFDMTGQWRDIYPNKRKVDASGTLFKKYQFANVLEFKQHLTSEEDRFARAFIAHVLRYALARPLSATDSLKVEAIAKRCQSDGYRLKEVLKQVIMSDAFSG